jgi:hypothetical protein
VIAKLSKEQQKNVFLYHVSQPARLAPTGEHRAQGRGGRVVGDLGNTCQACISMIEEVQSGCAMSHSQHAWHQQVKGGGARGSPGSKGGGCHRPRERLLAIFWQRGWRGMTGGGGVQHAQVTKEPHGGGGGTSDTCREYAVEAVPCSTACTLSLSG